MKKELQQGKVIENGCDQGKQMKEMLEGHKNARRHEMEVEQLEKWSSGRRGEKKKGNLVLGKHTY